LAAALERVLADGQLRDRLARAARQHVLARHDLDRIAEEYLDLFRELVGHD
jgi:glycosyltransferase involved in cell wall biosynthesis